MPVGDTIMAALNKNGYTFLLGCRRGGCGICKVRVDEAELDGMADDIHDDGRTQTPHPE